MLDPVKYKADLDAYLLRREPKMFEDIRKMIPLMFKRIQQRLEDHKLTEFDHFHTLFYEQIDSDSFLLSLLEPRHDERTPDSSMITLIGLEKCINVSLWNRLVQNVNDDVNQYVE